LTGKLDIICFVIEFITHLRLQMHYYLHQRKELML